jgi:lipopolysaccharide/colanic/teichoic acid biosynthesis glycosyltransferase
MLTAASLLVLLGWLIAVLAWVTRRSTGASGLFRQTRVGQSGRPFEILKLRTMWPTGPTETTVTVAGDSRITKLGAFLRRTKLDELPQLINVLRGQMSLVGPRPDVIDFVDLASPQVQVVLSVRPGITGPASLVFRDEENLLAQQEDPEAFNLQWLVPAKTRINEHYVRTWRMRRDLRYLMLTMTGGSLTEAEALA